MNNRVSAGVYMCFTFRHVKGLTWSLSGGSWICFLFPNVHRTLCLLSWGARVHDFRFGVDASPAVHFFYYRVAPPPDKTVQPIRLSVTERLKSNKHHHEVFCRRTGPCSDLGFGQFLLGCLPFVRTCRRRRGFSEGFHNVRTLLAFVALGKLKVGPHTDTDCRM